jgi:hypothetical protein
MPPGTHSSRGVDLCRRARPPRRSCRPDENRRASRNRDSQRCRRGSGWTWGTPSVQSAGWDEATQFFGRQKQRFTLRRREILLHIFQASVRRRSLQDTASEREMLLDGLVCPLKLPVLGGSQLSQRFISEVCPLKSARPGKPGGPRDCKSTMFSGPAFDPSTAILRRRASRLREINTLRNGNRNTRFRRRRVRRSATGTAPVIPQTVDNSPGERRSAAEMRRLALVLLRSASPRTVISRIHFPYLGQASKACLRELIFTIINFL